MLEERGNLDIRKATALLMACGLSVPESTDYTVGVYDGDALVATGSLRGDMIQGLAVSPDARGEDLTAKVLTHLIAHAAAQRHRSLHLFTKPASAAQFASLGLATIAVARPYAALLEWGEGIAPYCAALRAHNGGKTGNAAIVMNANPFTLGHQFLVETAANEQPHVYVLAVEEDLSVFPFADRLRLIRQGTAHLPNVTVIPGGRYAVSSLTFPAYFTQQEQLAHAHAAMDAEIFARHIGPALSVTTRYVGTEPYSPVTAIYNDALMQRLPPAGIAVKLLERKQRADDAISASRVRRLLAAGDWDALAPLVPPTTLAYLLSDAALPIRKKLIAQRTKEPPCER